MNQSLCVVSPAKLNLFLHITGRRSDGYHELQTLFQLLDWGDTMHFATDHSGEIQLDMVDLGIPDAQNLIVRAARALIRGNLGATIRVDKCIPEGGGLGGGSSNAATTLLVLNHLWGLGYSKADLATIGAKLGADVPVFVHGHTAWAEGIGDVLTPVKLPQCWYLVLQPSCKVNTGEIFSHPQLTRDASAIKMAAFFEGQSRNDCQPLVRDLYHEIDEALKWLGNFGEARLTGTGACIFARFENKGEADTVLEQIPKPWLGYVAKGINDSPVLASLL